jgi:hypothetical protein
MPRELDDAYADAYGGYSEYAYGTHYRGRVAGDAYDDPYGYDRGYYDDGAYGYDDPHPEPMNSGGTTQHSAPITGSSAQSQAYRPTGATADEPSRSQHRHRRRHTSKPSSKLRHRSKSGEDGEHRRGRHRRTDKDSSKPTTAELAAAAVEHWKSLDPADRHLPLPTHAGDSRAPSRASPLAGQQDALVVASREAAALRELVHDERRRLHRELRSLKRGWESADERATRLEGQLISTSCSEASLAKEVAQADGLTSWWREQWAEGQRRAKAHADSLHAANQNVEGLTVQLEVAGVKVRALLQSSQSSGPSHPRAQDSAR